MKKHLILLMIILSIFVLPNVTNAKEKELEINFYTQSIFETPYIQEYVFEFMMNKGLLLQANQSNNSTKNFYNINGKVLMTIDYNNRQIIIPNNVTESDSISFTIKGDECSRGINYHLSASSLPEEDALEAIANEDFILSNNKYCEYLMNYNRITVKFNNKELMKDTMNINLYSEDQMYQTISPISILMMEYIYDNNYIIPEQSNACDKNTYYTNASGKRLYYINRYDSKNILNVMKNLTTDDNITINITNAIRNTLEQNIPMQLDQYKTINLNVVPTETNEKVIIKDIQLLKKSDNSSLIVEPTKDNSLTVNSDISLLKQGDYVQYVVTLENKTNLPYLIELGNAPSEYVDYKLDYNNGNTINGKETKQVYLTIKLKKDPDASVMVGDSYNPYFKDNNRVEIQLTNSLSNPATYRSMISVILFVLLLVLVTLIIKSKGNKGIYSTLSILIILILSISMVDAAERITLNVNSSVTVYNGLVYNGENLMNDDVIQAKMVHLKNKMDSQCITNHTCPSDDTYELFFEATSDLSVDVKMINFPSKEDSIDILTNINIESDAESEDSLIVVGECTAAAEIPSSIYQKFSWHRETLTSPQYIQYYIQDEMCPRLRELLEFLDADCVKNIIDSSLPTGR